MSSLSQEDLDAGWDGLEAAGAVTREVASAEALALQSTPPNSMTIDKSPAPLESLVVPAATESLNESDSSESQAVPAMPLANATTETIASPDAPNQSVATEESVATSLGTFQVVADKPELFNVSHTSLQIESAPDSPSTQSNDVSLLPTRLTPIQDEHPTSVTTEAAPSSAHVQEDEPVQNAISDTPAGAVPSEPPTSKAEPIQVERQTQPDEPTQSMPVAFQTAPVQAVLVASETPQLNAEIAQEHLAEPLKERTSTVAVVTTNATATEVAARSASAGAQARPVRIMVWGAAAVTGLIVGYMALLLGRHANRHATPAANVIHSEANSINAVVSPTHDEAPSPVADVKVTNDSVVTAASAAPAGKAGNVDSAASRPQSESFSDAFVKHAASVNSNWAEVKKRPRVSESNASGRPAGAPAGKAGDDPLNVLDQLEKARKAKKQTPSRP